MMVVPEMEPVPQPDNDNCLADEMNRIVDYGYDDYYSDYEDEACASVQDYPITNNRKYSTYDAQGLCKVPFIDNINILIIIVDTLSKRKSSKSRSNSNWQPRPSSKAQNTWRKQSK